MKHLLLNFFIAIISSLVFIFLSYFISLAFGISISLIATGLLCGIIAHNLKRWDNAWFYVLALLYNIMGIYLIYKYTIHGESYDIAAIALWIVFQILVNLIKNVAAFFPTHKIWLQKYAFKEFFLFSNIFFMAAFAYMTSHFFPPENRIFQVILIVWLGLIIVFDFLLTLQLMFNEKKS